MDQYGKEPRKPLLSRKDFKAPEIPPSLLSSRSLSNSLTSLEDSAAVQAISLLEPKSRRSVSHFCADSQVKRPPSTTSTNFASNVNKFQHHDEPRKPKNPTTSISHTSSKAFTAPREAKKSVVVNQTKRGRLRPKSSCKVMEVKDFEAPPPVPIIEGHLPWNLETKLESCLRLNAPKPEPKDASRGTKDSAVAKDLSQPRFNSSLKLMRDLEILKQHEIDGDSLVQSKLKCDAKLKEALQRIESTAANIPPKQTVFKGLTSLELDEQNLIAQREQECQKLAARIAPKTKAKDPEPKLSDFFTPYDIPSEAPLPAYQDLWKEYDFAQMAKPEDPGFDDGMVVYHAITKHISRLK